MSAHLHANEQGANPGTHEMSPACEAAFCQTIARRTGIVLQDHQLSNLRETIRSGCARFGFDSSVDYFNHIDFAQSLTPPLEYLVAGITVGESYFFRDSEQIALLRDKLLPDIIAEKRRTGDLSIRIWSAGCSNGQEIYSIAMLLFDLLPDMAAWRVHLLGTDINTQVLARALRGRYSEWSFRAMTPEQKARWFTATGHEYEISPKIRGLARFSYLNLTEDSFPSIHGETNALDLILCRNVFIYLDREVIRRTMGRFADCLVESGVLLLGASDPVDASNSTLVWHQYGNTSYFNKRKPSPASTRPETSSLQVADYPAMEVQARLSPKKAVSVQKVRRHIPESDQHIPEADPAREVLSAIARHLQRDEWDMAVSAVEAIERNGQASSVLLQMKAQALASLGRLEDAQQACVRSLELDPDNAHAYLIRALVLAELDRVQEAETSLNHALYLDHELVEAHYELGMLRMRTGQVAGGLKSLENALKLATEGDPDRQFHNAGGMTYGRFVQVLESEMEIYRNVGNAQAVRLPVRRK